MAAIDLKLPKPTDDSDRKLLADVEQVGWHCVGILEEAEPYFPPYVFSVGMYYMLGTAELVVTGLPHQVATAIINSIGDAVRGGLKINCDQRLSGFLEGFDVVLRPVDPVNYSEHLGYSVWFYRSLPKLFPCWQVFWPDREGKFPWDSGCHPGVHLRQCIFTGSVS